MTDDDIMDTLEEIYKNEEMSEKDEIVTKDKHQSKSAKMIENVLTPEFDNLTAEMSTGFTQLTKRKYTILNSEKQVLSGLVIKIIIIQHP